MMVLILKHTKNVWLYLRPGVVPNVPAAINDNKSVYKVVVFVGLLFFFGCTITCQHNKQHRVSFSDLSLIKPRIGTYNKIYPQPHDLYWPGHA